MDTKQGRSGSGESRFEMDCAGSLRAVLLAADPKEDHLG